jgi:SAM-dependent methyltransferase
LSPFLRDQRIKAAKPYLRGRILDVGCGSGALARHVAASSYMGVDVDEGSLAIARRDFPNYLFRRDMPPEEEKFDTIIALAVIEHVPDPADFLRRLSLHLRPSNDALIVCTTPHPAMDWIHGLGSKLGIFSRSANEEHEDLLDRNRLDSVGREVGLAIKTYKRFLFGANQIALFGQEEAIPELSLRAQERRV